MFFKLLPLGIKAPTFSLPDAQGTLISLSDFIGQAVVLIFYPADFTPGCTGQLCMYRDASALLAEAGMRVLAINPGSAESHQKFMQTHQLPFPLLEDKGFTVAKLYKATLIPGVIQNRVVYGIDANGLIQFAQVGNPTPEKVLTSLGLL
jgi:thioredoxin-dependent peroxiredoxin